MGNAGKNTNTAGVVSSTAPAASSATPSASVNPPSDPPASPPSAVDPAATPPSTTAPQPPGEDSEYGNYPSGEHDFVAAVEKAREDASSAENDLQYGAALSRRNRSLCKIVSSGKAQDWVGRISTLDSNGDGYGVLAVAIADGAAIGTWNNALSDYQDNTLIKPGNLLDKLSNLEEGQLVEFSGRFIKQSGTCVNDKRLTKVGKLEDPEFVFKFSAVKAIS